jgi:hypothetical protein
MLFEQIKEKYYYFRQKSGINPNELHISIADLKLLETENYNVGFLTFTQDNRIYCYGMLVIVHDDISNFEVKYKIK